MTRCAIPTCPDTPAARIVFDGFIEIWSCYWHVTKAQELGLQSSHGLWKSMDTYYEQP